MLAGTALRWGTKHGLMRAGIRAAARKGDEQARFFNDPAVRADPYPFYASVRAAGPVVRGRLMWATARHDLAGAVLRHDAFGVGFSDRAMPGLVGAVFRYSRRSSPIGPVDPPSMLVTDPPDHGRYRRLVSKVFTARAIEGLRPRIEQTCAELLRDKPVDLVADFASLLPVTVIAEILGVPLDMRRQFLAWGNAAAPTLDLGLGFSTYRRTEVNIKRVNDWMRGHFARLRREPGDDLLSQLVQLDDLSEDELLATAGLLLAAGFETTVNLLGTGAWLLMRHPEQLAVLRDEPQRWGNAVEETLRYDSPVQVTARVCRRATEFGGARIEPGQVVMSMLAGANRDPDVFEHPDEFDVTRANAREHLSFSGGAHYCLGAALARLEGEIGLRMLFERYPDLRIDGEPHRRTTRVLRGFESLPVTI
ncbi:MULTISPECIES: cytochrome P450 [Dactylosporangium]|uniref:Cytochrome P450 n=2 Tax=Dactylosporangium TaxID=35753 RepID=A0A9W6KT54_9ACTN|nr:MULTISPECIES: cytochrome P450 [Dactylosporangium]UAB93278.1 cytochrome P450 [Dactylosporangium vinaceum]UWZ41659.1 cytochrome P450 [Dactylosporangium matsuzakiense]GLL06705.1 cytochrome P450 [Dactylosporangium matsuzakiense]